ncbi:MAG: tetratricopeptide repeat protein [Ignavibacteriales bacterium]|nr:tetratricopeptide repeat protein [Ignavibacteriales bacterium]
MLKPQKKISRREIKEDKLVTKYFEARQWIDENTKILSYVGIGIAGLVIIGFLWSKSRADSNLKATAMLAKVTPYYDEGRYDLAINGVPQEGTQGLQAVVDEHGSTQAGEIAKLYLANSYFALKSYDKALNTYDDISVSDKMITASAYAGMAACYEAKSDFSHAASYFEKAASKNMTVMQGPENLQRSATNYAAAGKKEKAIELLQTLKKEFPTSPYARDVERLIAEYSV